MIEDKQAIRLRVLALLYKFVDADTRKWVDLRDLCSRNGISGDEFTKAHQFLEDAALIRPYGAGYTSMITHQGIVAIEAAYKSPERSSQYFPAINDIEVSNGTVEKL